MAWFDAFRKDFGPTWYGDNRTPVLTDITTLSIFLVFLVLLLAFLIIFPGIRRQRWSSFLSVVLSLSVGSILLSTIFYPCWQKGEVRIYSTYRSFSQNKLEADLGVTIGLSQLNVTLRGHSNDSLLGTEVSLDYNERFTFTEVRSMKVELAEGLGKGLPYPMLSVIEYLSVDRAGFIWGRQYRLAGYYTCIILCFFFMICLDETEVTSRRNSTTLDLAAGASNPGKRPHVLQLRTRFCWGVWTLKLLMLCLVPEYYSRTLLFLGGSILLADIVYYVASPKNLVIHFPTDSEQITELKFHFGWCFWATLSAGLVCFLIGATIRLLEVYSVCVFVTFLQADFDEVSSSPYSHNHNGTFNDQSSSSANRSRLGSAESFSASPTSNRAGSIAGSDEFVEKYSVEQVKADKKRTNKQQNRMTTGGTKNTTTVVYSANSSNNASYGNGDNSMNNNMKSNNNNSKHKNNSINKDNKKWLADGRHVSGVDYGTNYRLPSSSSSISPPSRSSSLRSNDVVDEGKNGIFIADSSNDHGGNNRKRYAQQQQQQRSTAGFSSDPSVFATINSSTNMYGFGSGPDLTGSKYAAPGVASAVSYDYSDKRRSVPPSFPPTTNNSSSSAAITTNNKNQTISSWMAAAERSSKKTVGESISTSSSSPSGGHHSSATTLPVANNVNSSGNGTVVGGGLRRIHQFPAAPPPLRQNPPPTSTNLSHYHYTGNSSNSDSRHNSSSYYEHR